MAAHTSLGEALCAVMADVRYVQKTGRNAFHKYSYASEGDLAAAVQPAMATHGLAMVPHRITIAREETAPTRSGARQWLTTVSGCYLLMHGASGQQIEVACVGSGIDGEDKGAYKAMTGALKYALRQMLILPTGDDPDADTIADEWAAACLGAGYTPEQVRVYSVGMGRGDPLDLPAENRAALLRHLRAECRLEGGTIRKQGSTA